jgi:hypothetical protein
MISQADLGSICEPRPGLYNIQQMIIISRLSKDGIERDESR